MRRTASELFWLLPFLFLALCSLMALRALPAFAPAAQSREIVDAAGTRVAVPLPVRVVEQYGPAGWLEATHAPQAIAAAGGSLFRMRFGTGLISRLYPRVLADDALWNDDDETTEAVLAHDPGGTYFLGADLDLMRKLGLAAVRASWHPKTRDAYIQTDVRVTNAALGQPDFGRALYGSYQHAYAELKRDLRPGPDLERPRVLTLGSSVDDWRMIWVNGPKLTEFEQEEDKVWDRNASADLIAEGRQQDAERILMMDPDYIFLNTETPAQFLQDPRWKGLKAVRERHVYAGVRDLRGSLVGSLGVDLGPVWSRWKAEIIHPGRLPPEVRSLLADRIYQLYGYRLSDATIDELLRTEENAGSAGYGRFLKPAPGNAPNDAAAAAMHPLPAQ